eukprot:gene10637-biopygen5878
MIPPSTGRYVADELQSANRDKDQAAGEEKVGILKPVLTLCPRRTREYEVFLNEILREYDVFLEECLREYEVLLKEGEASAFPISPRRNAMRIDSKELTARDATSVWEGGRILRKAWGV